MICLPGPTGSWFHKPNCMNYNLSFSPFLNFAAKFDCHDRESEKLTQNLLISDPQKNIAFFFDRYMIVFRRKKDFWKLGKIKKSKMK